MRRTKRVPRVYAAKAVYLDPQDSGSVVGYSITSFRQLHASVDLSDCNRKISWMFDNSPGNKALEKVDAVLKIMTEFRQDLVSARKAFNRRK